MRAQSVRNGGDNDGHAFVSVQRRGENDTKDAKGRRGRRVCVRGRWCHLSVRTLCNVSVHSGMSW